MTFTRLVDRLDDLADEVWERARAPFITNDERERWVDAYVAIDKAIDLLFDAEARALTEKEH